MGFTFYGLKGGEEKLLKIIWNIRKNVHIVYKYTYIHCSRWKRVKFYEMKRKICFTVPSIRPFEGFFPFWEFQFIISFKRLEAVIKYIFTWGDDWGNLQQKTPVYLKATVYFKAFLDEQFILIIEKFARGQDWRKISL